MVIFLITVSCSSDFTEVKPNGVLESTTFFDNEKNAEQAIIGLYDLLQYNNSVSWSSALFIKVLPGDDANTGGGNATDQKQLQDIDDYANISISSRFFNVSFKNSTQKSSYLCYFGTIREVCILI